MNAYGGVHGGALFTWVDLMTKLSVTAYDSKKREHSLIGMNVNYINGIKKNSKIFVKATVQKIGGSLAFTECQILDQKGNLVLSASV